MNEPLRKVIFVFSYPMLFNVWDRAKEIVRADGIEIVIVNQSGGIDWEAEGVPLFESADAVYFAAIRYFPHFETLAALSPKARHVLPAGTDAAAAPGRQDDAAARRLDEYFTAGSPEDLANAARWLLHRAGVLAAAPPEPGQALLCGIYHPGAEKPFADLAAYLAWLRQKKGAPTRLPRVAVCFPRAWALSEDMALVHATVEPLERKGFHPVLVFCDGDLASRFGARARHPLDDILVQCGPSLAAIWCMLATGAGSEEITDPFHAYGVPVFQILRNHYQTVTEWEASQEGLSATSLCYGLTKPEMHGCIEPTLLACDEPVPGERWQGRLHKAVPVGERIEHLAGRTARWHRLRVLPNGEKRIAIMLHQAPCKGVEATLGRAAGLNSTDSAVAIMRRLDEEGYTVCDIPASGRELLDRILEKKALPEFRWTNVGEIEAKGGAVAHIYEEDYRRDFEKLSSAAQKSINESWDPFPGEAMVLGKESEHPCLLITGIWFGNILVMVDPKRGCHGPKCDGEVCRILHDPDISPPHHWLATFWYLQREVDALVSLGTASPLDYLRGKRAALSGECFPEISLGALPVV